MAEGVSSSVVGKVLDSVFGVIKTEIGYIWNCTQNVETFKNEVEKLKVMKGRVQQQIDIAKAEGNNLIVGVEKWMEDAAQEISKAEVFLEQEVNAKKTCFKIGMCGNWGTLHRYGKKTVTEMTPALLEHQVCGKDFVTCVSVYTRPPGPLDVYENKHLDDIVTQNSALNDIITALEDDNIQIIGIYGLGGVGKTTLAKEVVAKVQNTLLFAHVAFTTVSQTVNAEKIQKDLESATKRIVKGEKVLIILDDVWEKLDLEELCIPCGSNYKKCKILLTSRNERVCQKMNAQSKICVNTLPAKEAWILFKRVVGERVETGVDLKPIAEEVTAECGGLPLLIQAVGNALKDESIESWKVALSRLKKPAALEMDPDIEKAFTRLKLSYEYLKSEEAKPCFLLCSMFPEDYNISLEDLVYYMVGLHKFNELESMENARDRVRNAVNMLTSSCLLLNTQLQGYTKMHDVVRDVALLIASQGRNKYLVRAGKGLTEWLPRDNNLKNYTGISLMRNMISKLPDYEVHLSSLDIFLVNLNEEMSMISDKFMEGMKDVKVLDMRLCRNAHLPRSLKQLTKLRMLNLTCIKSLHEISILGEMKELEILLLSYTGIKEISQEIGQLVKLRRLEVIGCEDMTYVAPGVISKLQSLEELCIDLGWTREGVNGCIVEIMKLSKLTYLELMVSSLDFIPEGLNSEELKGFLIQIGRFHRDNVRRRSDRYLILFEERHLVIPLVKWLKKLIEVSRPHILLNGIENLSHIMPTLYDEGFNKLAHIDLSWCPNVSCLVDDDESTVSCDWDEGKTKEKYFMELKHLDLCGLNKLEVLWKCTDEYISLTNLVTLKISKCPKLERIFTVSVAQGLVYLKDLIILSCNSLEEVIYSGVGGDEESGNVIVFPSLTNIYFRYLYRLKSFFNSAAAAAGNCSSIIIKYPSLVDLTIYDCRRMKIWGPEIHETPNLKTLHDMGFVPVGRFSINEAVEKYYKVNHPSNDESNNNDAE